MRHKNSFFTAVISSLCLLATPIAARAGIYETLAEFAYTVKEARCKPVSRETALRVATGCEQFDARVLTPQLERQLALPAELVENDFFERARAQLLPQQACSLGKIEALRRGPGERGASETDSLAQDAFVRDLASKIGALREIVQRTRERQRELNAVWQPGTNPLLESSSRPEAIAKGRVYREAVAELKELSARYDTIRAATPLSQFSEIARFIDFASGRSGITPDVAASKLWSGISEKTSLDPANLAQTVRPALDRIRDDLRTQGEALDPARPLSRILREEIVKDEEMTRTLLAEMPLGDEGREAAECRLESRYGRGTEHEEDITTWLFLGSFIQFKGRPAAALARPFKSLRRPTAAVLKAARAEWVVSPTVRHALLIGLRSGLLTLDGLDRAERNCFESPVSHYRAQDPFAASAKPSRHWWGKDREADPREAGAGEGCDGQQFMDELKRTNCAVSAAMFSIDGMAARDPKGVPVSLLHQLDDAAMRLARPTSWGIWFADPMGVLPAGSRDVIKKLREGDAETEKSSD